MAVPRKFLGQAATPAYVLVRDVDLSLSDTEQNDVSILEHGFTPKLPNDATKFLNGVGDWEVPSGGGGGITELTGDVAAGPGSGSQVATLASTGVAAATYGSATKVPVIAVDVKGRITAASEATISDTGITQLTSDVVAGPGSGSQAATIANSAVTNAKMADMAAHTFKARNTNSTGAPEDATATQATALLDAMVGDTGTGGTKGLVPAPASGDAAAGKYLNAAGGFSVPPGTGTPGSTISSTAIGSEPGSPATGDADLYTNSFYIARYSGAIWAPWGPLYPMVQPIDGDYAWVNQGSATKSTTNGGVRLDIPAVASDNVRLRVKSQPTTPYTITAAFFIDQLPLENYFSGGLAFRESGTSKIVQWTIGYTLNTIRMVNWTNETSFSSSAYSRDMAGIIALNALVWLRIANDGTTLSFSYSVDGYNFRVLTTTLVGAWFTVAPNQVGFGCYLNNGTYPCGLTLLSWKQT